MSGDEVMILGNELTANDIANRPHAALPNKLAQPLSLRSWHGKFAVAWFLRGIRSIRKGSGDYGDRSESI